MKKSKEVKEGKDSLIAVWLWLKSKNFDDDKGEPGEQVARIINQRNFDDKGEPGDQVARMTKQHKQKYQVMHSSQHGLL